MNKRSINIDISTTCMNKRSTNTDILVLYAEDNGMACYDKFVPSFERMIEEKSSIHVVDL